MLAIFAMTLAIGTPGAADRFEPRPETSLQRVLRVEMPSVVLCVEEHVSSLVENGMRSRKQIKTTVRTCGSPVVNAGHMSQERMNAIIDKLADREIDALLHSNSN